MYQTRRTRLALEDTAMVLRTGATGRSPDAIYLGGLRAPHQTLVLTSERAVLFLPPPDVLDEHWNGARPTWEDVAATAEVEDVRPDWALARDLPDLLRGAKTLAWSMGEDPAFDAQMISRLGGRGASTTRTITGPWRARKDAHELDLMRRAGHATALAHEEVFEGMCEGDTGIALAGAHRAALAQRGLRADAFDGIFAGGVETTCLHPRPSPRALRDGDFVLIDAGGAWEGYAADMSRTRVVGTPTQAQEALHEVVCRAYAAALRACLPQQTLAGVHEIAKATLASGLEDLGFAGDVTHWFTHRTSHFIGLEVHDPGDLNAPLEDGMVFTLEPGLYVDVADTTAPKEFRGLGVRTEDTVAMVAGEVEVLTGPRARHEL